MCGICGYVSRSGDGSWIEPMERSLTHRGPDDHGTATFAAAGCTVALGHRRLSVIDPSPAGHQPMSDPRGAACIVYNGEIYNFRALRKRLEASGRAFASLSDTEVVLQAYLEWGEACVERFNGMFAFCIYDRRTGTLFLARDRTGIKPLYYYRKGPDFAFASELKALVAYRGFDKRVDPASVWEYLSFQYVPAPRSIFQDTYKLEPGCALRYSTTTGTLSTSRYWDPLEPPPPAAAEPVPEKHVLDEFERRLLASVESHMVSDVPLGAFLSGGVDSSLVTAAMTRVRPGNVKTFCIGFEEKHHDEAPFARRVAAHLGTDHHEHYMASRDLLSAIPAMVECYDEPFADPSALPMYFLSRFARGEVTVALSGDGGDELMGGYARYARAGLVGTTARWLPSIARRALFGLVKRLPALTPDAVMTGIPDDPLRMFHYLVARFKEDDHERLIGHRYDFSGTRFERAFHETSDRELLARLLLVDFVTYLPDQMFTKVDRASMAHALEVRVPLMDNDLVAYAFGLPISYKVRGRQTKVLLKKLLERYLPADLFRRPKSGFSPPIDEWLRGDLRHLVDRYLKPERIRERGLLNADFLATVVARHRAGHRGFQHMLWTTVVLEMWFERWID